MKTRVSLKYMVSYCLWKHFCDSNSPRIPPGSFKPNFLEMFGISKAFYTVFDLKLKKLSCEKLLNFALIGGCFSDLFTVVEIWY